MWKERLSYRLQRRRRVDSFTSPSSRERADSIELVRVDQRSIISNTRLENTPMIYRRSFEHFLLAPHSSPESDVRSRLLDDQSISASRIIQPFSNGGITLALLQVHVLMMPMSNCRQLLGSMFQLSKYECIQHCSYYHWIKTAVFVIHLPPSQKSLDNHTGIQRLALRKMDHIFNMCKQVDVAHQY